MKKHSENKIKKLFTKIDEEIKSLLKLKKTEKEEKNKDVVEMIKYYSQLTNEIENRRIRIHDFTLAMLTIAIAGIGILLSDKISFNSEIYYPMLFSLIFVVICGGYVAFIYERQSGFRYPFLNIEQYGNTWKWFYYGSKDIQKINTRVFPKSDDFVDTHEPYLKGFETFIRKYRIEDIDLALKDNITQLYLLKVHNYYKNKFYLQLSKVWNFIMLGLIVVFIFTFIIRYFCLNL